MQQPFDRAAEDLGNSIHFEHVNVTVPDQRLATLFYVAGLGLTRDPYLMVSDTNMWVNVGRSQFHLPNGGPQVLRGHTGIVIAGREALLERLASVAKSSKAPRSLHRAQRPCPGDLPLGQPHSLLRARCRAFRAHHAGHPLCRIRRAGGTAKGICAFYAEIIEMQAEVLNGETRCADQGRQGSIPHFRETDRRAAGVRRPSRPDRHHNFSGPYHRLREKSLVSTEDNHIIRFRDSRPRGRQASVHRRARGAQHDAPDLLRPLVNRNPAETNRTYAPGHEQWAYAMGPDAYDQR